jgi:Spy/CpxP family protein refolding chaperone
MEDMFMRRIQSSAAAIGTALLLVIGVSAAVHAQGEGPGRHRPFGPGRGGFAGLRQLDLTEAQRGQVRDIMQRQRSAVETIPVNEGLIRSTAQALANAQTDMALLQARIHSEVWSLLTPEQQEKAKQLKSERAARVKQRREQRTPRRQG